MVSPPASTRTTQGRCADGSPAGLDPSPAGSGSTGNDTRQQRSNRPRPGGKPSGRGPFGRDGIGARWRQSSTQRVPPPRHRRPAPPHGRTTPGSVSAGQQEEALRRACWSSPPGCPLLWGVRAVVPGSSPVPTRALPALGLLLVGAPARRAEQWTGPLVRHPGGDRVEPRVAGCARPGGLWAASRLAAADRVPCRSAQALPEWQVPCAGE
jgi:hypothetical protein